MDQKYRYALAKNFRQLRGNQTQAVIADKLGVTVQTISNWENGRQHPTARLLEKIAECFSTTVVALFECKR